MNQFAAHLLQLAGLAQFAMVFAGLATPFLLRWQPELAPLRPILRQLFWTYGGYILGTNLFFGLFCGLFPTALLAPNPAAIALNVYLLLFWIARLFVQFFYFDRNALGQGLPQRVAETLLTLVVLTLILAYGFALWVCLQ